MNWDTDSRVAYKSEHSGGELDMYTLKLRQFIAGAGSGLLLLALVTGCSGGNAGGNTKCKDYLRMTSSQQSEVIKKYYKQNKIDENQPNWDISVARYSALLYCSTIGTDNDTINDISG